MSVEYAKKQTYDRLKREMRDVYSSRLNDIQRSIEARQTSDGALQDASMIIMQNSIDQMNGFKDLEIHLD